MIAMALCRRARGRDHGRAHHRARRRGPARDPAPGLRAQGPARLLGPLHHPRPVAAAGGRRPRGDHVRGTGRGVCAHGAGPPRRRPSLHPRAARLVPAPARRAPRSSRGSPARRRTCARAGRLPVRAALRLRHRRLRRGRHEPPAVDGGGNGSAVPDHLTACPFVTAHTPSASGRRPGVAFSAPPTPAAAAAGDAGDGELVLEAVNLSKDYRSGHGRRAQRHLGGAGGLVRAPSRVGGGTGRGERLGQEHDRQAAGRSGAAHRRTDPAGRHRRSTPPRAASSARTRARCRWSSRTRSPR